MITLSFKQLKQILREEASKLYQADDSLIFSGIQFDSRKITPGNLFLALEGQKVNGHDFIADVKEKGAVLAIVTKLMPVDFPQIQVRDPVIAFGLLAAYWRKQFSIPVVGITGSCGKTTTKQMMGAILSEAGHCLMTQGNLNNQLGVPLTLCELSSEHQFAVIEMGASRKGDIAYLSHIVQPTISVITNVAPVHLQGSDGTGLGSIEGVFQEKTEIFKGLQKSGMAIINADDDFYPRWKKAFPCHISFGFSTEATVTASQLVPNTEKQYAFVLKTPTGEIALQLSSLGKHNVINALAAAAVAYQLDIPLEKIAKGLSNVPVAERRMVKIPLSKGVILIDDSYNANVKSMEAAIEMLAEHAGKKMLIMGDMLEMGAESLAAHQRIGELAKAAKIDYLLAIGQDSLAAVKAFGEAGAHFEIHQALAEAAKNYFEPGLLIISKGSHGMALDKVVELLRNF
jgi:UDP-N-acetylmuramoyl-tripeptide--D-alanyl-D-alanine ligase